MFFYLSFLRTPPHSSLPSSSVVFTPQVSNDLRTEPFPTNVDIFYWWISCTPQNVTTRLSEPAKLTTWRQENAYKPVQIPPPPLKNVVGPADCSRPVLVLSPEQIAASLVIDLRDPEIGRVPFPVCSLPLQIISPPRRHNEDDDGRGLATKTSSSPKQEAITRTFRLFDGDAMTMRIKETVSFDLDKKLWDSGIGLSAWLVRLSVVDVAPSSSSQPAIVREFKERLFGREECRIIELGAGTGIVSMVLAALRSACLASAHETRILSTDLPSSMELMSHNINTNVELYPHCPPSLLPLDWDDEQLPETVRSVIVRERGGFDVVAMADVTYNTSSFPALLRTLASLLAPPSATTAAYSSPHCGVTVADPDPDPDASGARDEDDERERDTLVLLAYKERDPAERQLWDMMTRETGIVLECVGKLAGAGGLPVEIWLGKKKKREPC